jgi:hypothetical protein
MDHGHVPILRQVPGPRELMRRKEGVDGSRTGEAQRSIKILVLIGALGGSLRRRVEAASANVAGKKMPLLRRDADA